ncbi:MAG: hypothetical protein KBD23_06495 [Gammaproteobacteria bacterium]|nr:hypothetical protein [Gammaproteobacteria bacterium]MBP9729761.1 hypothetical protein [Gammaproteobacteria bacterium]
MLLKNFLIEELKKLFGGTEETICSVSKKIFVYVGIYAALMLVTFGLAATFAAGHVFFLAGVFSFLFYIEAVVISVLYGLFVLSILGYYSAYFFRKGWDR